jgi:hypothetical protein
MAGAGGASGFEQGTSIRSEGKRPVDEDHTDGTMGLAPMDTRYQQRKNTQPTHRSSVIEDPGGRTKTML